MTTLKYDLLLLDRGTMFSLRQVKMRVVLLQPDDALLGIDKMSAGLSVDEKQRKDRKVLIISYSSIK